MNRIYRHIWSKALGRLIVVPECAKGGQRKTSPRRRHLAALVASALLAGPASAGDLPVGGTVVSGSGTITTNGAAMTVNQSSDKMIANWQSFSIGSGNSVTFNQPTTSSVALNRVVGQDASQILGKLTANGQVFLINPNGVVIGQGAQVRTGSFVASTLGISDKDFLSGNYEFKGTGGPIVNNGDISGHVVALIAPSVTNAGTITGATALAAGTDVLLDFDGDGLISVAVKASTMETLVENKGLIKANGGTAILTAKGASDAMKGVVNNSGTIQARTIAKKKGRILLLGDMDNGEVNVSGTLDASAPSGGNGGFIETSAKKVKVSDSAKITTKAASGATGNWLIDPNDYTIAASGGDMTGTALSSLLATTNVTIESTNGATSGNGDLFVNDSVTWSTNTLTLSAYRNIEINAALHGSGTAGLALEYGQGAIASGNAATYSINAAVNLASTGSFSTKLGSDGVTTNYTIITDIDALQAVNNNGLSANFVLGNDIDASETASWNSGAGFDPLGDASTQFTGHFDGLGHVISGLTIDRPSENYVGLFGYTSGATIRGVGLENLNVTGASFVGGLTGTGDSSAISDVYVAGSVSGAGYVGGLIGLNNASSTVSNAFAAGRVTGGGLYIGGLAGGNFSSTIRNSYATGSVTGLDYAGGLVGRSLSSTISNTYATGSVSAVGNGSFAGGLVAWDNSSTITGSFWNIETSGQTSGIGRGGSSGQTVTGLTTAAMLNAASFGGLDFTSVWGIKEGETSPYLQALGRHSVLLRDGDAYLSVQTLAQLQAINNDLSANYVLFNDIDASETAHWNSGAGFDPLGDAGAQFTGKLDGLGHVITGLTIDRPSDAYTGLFGYISGATIRNVGLENLNVTGASFVGGLTGTGDSSAISDVYVAGSVSGAGYVGGLIGLSNASSTINNAFAAGRVTGGGLYIGGLAGASFSSTISNAYATGSVTGLDYAGGLVGRSLSSTISNTYATGSVSAVGNGSFAGGLVAWDNSSTITGSFWNIETSGQTSGIGRGSSSGQTVTGLTTAAMLNAASFGGLDFTSVWSIQEGETSPYLQAHGRHSVLLSDGEAYLSVLTPAQLQAINKDLSANYVLFNDIDASETASWNSGAGFDPLGDSGTKFTGHFDGLGHVISGLTIDRLSQNYVGLFGYTSGAAIRDIGLEDLNVTGATYVGGLIGYNSASSISDVYAAGRIAGSSNTGGLVGYNHISTIGNAYSLANVAGSSSYVGGLVGYNDTSTINNAYAAGDVTGGTYVGGLAGVNLTASISNAYATGRVTGGSNVGGLVGYNAFSSSIANAFATGSVTGSTYAGGLVGYNISSTVTGSFWNTETSGQVSGIGGDSSGQTVTGLTTAGMLNAASFSGLDFTTVWSIKEGETSPYLQALGRHSVLLSDGDAYLSVQTPAQLQAIKNDLGANYVLFNDIDASGTASWNAGAGFDPLGDASAQFTGKLDGLGYAITGLTIDRPSEDLVGLFGYISGATIRNVGLDGGSVTGRTYVGGLAALSYASTISNVHAAGSVTSSTMYAGGLVALSSHTTISNVYATGSVTGGSLVGGLVGYDETSTISNAYADNNVSGNTYVGGLVGLNYLSTISNAYALGDVTGSLYVGGLAGHNETSTIVNTYAAGKVTGDTYVGGLLGSNYDSTVAASFWNSETSGQDSGIGVDNYSQTVTGLTSAKMQDPFTFIDAGWNFSSVWGTPRTGGAPQLRALADATSLYTYYVRLSGELTRTYGDTVGTSGIALDGVGTANVTLEWGSAITSTTNVGRYGYGDAGVLALSYAAGTAADYYVKYGTDGLTINPASVTVSISDLSKTYDGTTTADTTAIVVSGQLFGTDSLSGGSFAYTDKNAGTGKTVTVSGVTVDDGNGGANYAVTYADNTNSTIDKAVISAITGITASKKTYDGTTMATLDTSGAGFSGIVAGDVLTVASATGAFTDKNAGAGKTVRIGDLTLGGTDAGNYTLADTTAATTADIVAKALTLSGFTVADKIYDGTTSATIDNLGALSGVIIGDSVSFSHAGALFADKNAGTNKAVTLSGVTLSGADATNYTISGTATTGADIAKAAITAITGITARGKLYDGTTVAALDLSNASFSGLFSGDSLTVAAATGVFDNGLPGYDRFVGITGLALGGADAGNYVLTSTTSSAAADIVAGNMPPFLPDQIEKPRYRGFDGPAARLLNPDPQLVEICPNFVGQE